MKKDITYIISIIIIICIIGLGVAYSTYGAPSEFGNETTTTCYVGGDYGIIDCMGNLTIGDIYPQEREIYDIGSGILRWGDIFVSDISGFDLDVNDILAHDIDITGNITGPFGNFTDLFVGGSNISDTYVPYTGANSNVDLGIYNLSTSSINTLPFTFKTGEGGSDRFIIGAGGDITMAGTFDNDGSLTTSKVFTVRNSRTLPYFITKTNNLGFTVYDRSASNNVMINLTTAGNYIGVGDVNATWFNGLFNWTTDTWSSFNGYNLTFNSTKLDSTYYNATQAQTIVGTIDGGTLADTQHLDGAYDGVTFNFSEASGSPGLDLRMNFTGITDFNRGVMRYKTGNLLGDYPIVQLWNYDDGVWEDYPIVGESQTFATMTQPVFDDADHITDGVVQMRIYKAGQGFAANHYYIDWVAISSGVGVPSGQEIDPYSFHRDENLNNSGYNITADYFFGNGSQLTGISGGSGGNVFDQVLNTTSDVTFNNLNVTGNGTFAGDFNKSILLGYTNVRLGAFSAANGWATISMESNNLGNPSVWVIDNGGAGIRIYETTPAAYQYARFRITNETIIFGENYFGRDIDLDITGDTTARGYVNISKTLNVTGNATFFQDVSVVGTLFGGSDLDMAGNVNIEGNLTVHNYFGNINWSWLQGYPVACPEGSAITQLGDGVICSEFTGGSELDPYWTANFTLYNDSWGQDTTYSQGTNMSFDGTTINWDGGWVLSMFAKIGDLLDYVKWGDIWDQVYNETEVDAINTSMKNYVDNQDIVFNDSIKAYIDGLPGGGEGASVGNTKTQVWTATNCPTSWTDIDLSGTVGSNSALVHITFQSTAGDMNAISLRANGDATEYHEKVAEVSSYGIAVGHHDSGGSATGGAVVLSSFTDNAGVVEWICETQREADAYLLGWVA